MSEVQPGQSPGSNGNQASESDPPLSEIAKRVRQHIADFEGELVELRAHRARLVKEHEKALAAIDGDIGICEGAIAGLTGKPAPSLKAIKPKRKNQPRRVGRMTGAGTATGFGVTLEACLVASRALKQMVAERVEAGEPETFTQKEFYRYPALDWDQSKGSQAIRYMRHIGFLRKAGRSEKTAAELWAIMDADAVEKAISEAERKAEEYEQHVVAQAGLGTTREQVVECLRQVGEPVAGAAELGRLTGTPKGSMSGIIKSLETDNIITVEQQGPGRPALISLRVTEEAVEA